MSHADIDPSLCTGEPTLESLDDGFSPPATDSTKGEAPEPARSAEAELAFSTQSQF